MARARAKHRQDRQTPPADRRVPPRLVAALLALAALAAYVNSLHGEFVFDDTALVQNNPQIRELGFAGLRRIFGSHYWQTVAGQGGLYRPMVMFSYAVNYALSGPDPFAYHLVNVLLHAANSTLVWLIVVELFGDRRFAFWSGLLFALHPIRTEAVAYVAGRAETLAAFFFLAAWWLYLKKRLAPAAAAFLLAVLSKESAFTFLAVLPISDHAARWKWERRTLARYLLFAGVAAAALGLRYLVLGGFAPLQITPSANPLAGASAAVRLMTATHVFGKYLWLLIYPAALSADYSYNQIELVNSPWEARFLVPALALAALAAATAWAFRRSLAPARPLFLCGAFLLATFSLTSNFLRPIGTIMAERLLYLPSLGFTCAVAYGLTALRRPRLATATGLLLAALYLARTSARNRDWKDHLSLFTSAAAVSPNSSLVQANLAGALLYARRDAAGAVEHARQAIRIEPLDPAAHMTLAEAHQLLGEWSRAAQAYARVEQLAPGTAGAVEAARRRQEVLRQVR